MELFFMKENETQHYAVDTRYPIEIGEQPDEENYKEALALAEYVYSWVQEKMGLL